MAFTIQHSLDLSIGTRNKARTIIEDLSTRLFSKDNCEISTLMYGSVEQGIAIDTSDLDMAVIGLHFNKEKGSLIEAQTMLFEEIQEKLVLLVKKSVNITTASVPIIKLTLLIDN